MFKFNDVKSRKQVNIALTYARNTKQSNADALLAYHSKRARLVDSRGEWELEKYTVQDHAS